MQSLFFFLFILFAGRATALNIVFGNPLGNITASDLFNSADNDLMATCKASCTPAMSAVQACGDTNDACLCSNATVIPLVACEQCMFTTLIAENIPQPEPLAGSQPALTAYAAACLASQNITIPATSITLALPSNWDGPTDLILNTPETVITLILGTILGGGGIWILSTL